MDLLERETSTLVLEDRWRSVSGDGGHIAVVLGEPGIGKTTLVNAFLNRLPPETRQLRGACEDFSIAEPLGPLREIGWQAGWSPTAFGTEQGVNRALFLEALDALTTVDRPTLILIEDLHWADDATLDFLRYAGRRIQTRKVFFVVTSRDGEAEGRPQMRRAFADVPSGCLSRIELEPLSAAAVSELAAGSGRDPATLHQTTGGNPFFVTELLTDNTGSVPRSVQDAILIRADRIDPSARRLLNIVSIFPRRADLDVVSEIAGEGFRTDLETCLSSDLLEEYGGFLAFRHELARQAIEVRLSWSEKSDLHGSVLQILTANAETPRSAILHHARHSDAAENIGELAAEAAEEAMAIASNREATEYFKLAIDHSRNPLQSEMAGLLEDCAWCSYLIGDFSQAIEMQERALDLLGASNDPVAEGEGYRKLSRYQWTRYASRNPAEKSALKAVEILGDFPGDALAMARSNLSQLMMLSWDLDAAIPIARKVIDYATANDRKEILSHAKNNLAVCLTWSDPERGAELFDQSVKLAREVENWDGMVRGYANWSEFEYRRMRYRRGTDLAALGLDVCERQELGGYVGYLSGVNAWNLLALGQWDEARKMAEAGMAAIDPARPTQGRFPPGIAFIQHMTRTGGGTSPKVAEELLQAENWTEELQHLWIFATTLAERAWLGFGGEERAIRLLEETLDRVSETRVVPDVAIWLRRLQPDRSIDAIETLPKPYKLTMMGYWKEAAEAWKEINAPYEQALALSEGEESACNEALTLLDRLGAKQTAEKIRESMKRRDMVLKRGPLSSTSDNPRGLTRRQMEVLALVDEGLSNTLIAERLFVSPKTIDHHVSAILLKLEASTRGEAAAIARMEGILANDKSSPDD